jgi:glycerol-3-phosphate dehydrogenase
MARQPKGASVAKDGMAEFDLLIVGGGINGAGIARDAAGRGLRVLLVEQDDLANHTSSSSTKLIHGGLRYLEYGEIALVRESLIERERLLGMAPHIIWPLRFVLPQSQSPRPAWMVRAGLFLYDHIGGRRKLPGTGTIDLSSDPMGEGLKDGGKAFVYSDCWVEDSRLTVLNAMDAALRGADIRTRTRLVAAREEGGHWVATLEDARGASEVRAAMLVNAAGPWVDDILRKLGCARNDRGVRLVKGSHIVVPRLYDGDHAFMLQNPDRRIVFAIPYEHDYTLIGTTDQPWEGPPGRAEISEEETHYLCDTANRYFERSIAPEDVRWSYAGIRPLYDDHAADASAVTRDYVLDLDAGERDEREARAPMLSIFGGKITTYRRLAEHALQQIAPFFPRMGRAWTAGITLPGGEMAGGDFGAFLGGLISRYPGFPRPFLHRLARAYGTRAELVLGEAASMAALGEDFGGTLFRREVDYLVEHEWARTAEDILWRRSKLGLHAGEGAAERLGSYLADRLSGNGNG